MRTRLCNGMFLFWLKSQKPVVPPWGITQLHPVKRVCVLEGQDPELELKENISLRRLLECCGIFPSARTSHVKECTTHPMTGERGLSGTNMWVCLKEKNRCKHKHGGRGRGEKREEGERGITKGESHTRHKLLISLWGKTRMYEPNRPVGGSVNQTGLQQAVWGSSKEILSKMTEWQSDSDKSSLPEAQDWRSVMVSLRIYLPSHRNNNSRILLGKISGNKNKNQVLQNFPMEEWISNCM